MKTSLRLLAAMGVLALSFPQVSHAQNNAAPANAAVVRRLEFDGVKAEQKWELNALSPALPADWTPYDYLVLELRTSTPQRFSLWVHTANGPRRIMLQPFGQNAWLRASIPLAYLRGRDQKGTDLASVNNRRTDSFWMSVWGPFGDLTAVQSLALVMDYPINQPTVEIRAARLSKTDEGSKFLDPTNVLDEFGQWAAGDWPRKIHSRAQLDKELADESQALGPGDFGYDRYGGYKDTHAEATGFFGWRRWRANGGSGSRRAFVFVHELERSVAGAAAGRAGRRIWRGARRRGGSMRGVSTPGARE